MVFVFNSLSLRERAGVRGIASLLFLAGLEVHPPSFA